MDFERLMIAIIIMIVIVLSTICIEFFIRNFHYVFYNIIVPIVIFLMGVGACYYLLGGNL